MLSAETHKGNREASGAGSYGRFLYNGFRYYDPEIGRYVSADPIGQLGGPNIYAYVLNNPLNAVDPLGLLGQVICTRCKGTGGPMECTVFDDGKEKFKFTSNEGTNETSITPGDEFGTNGPLPPGELDLPNAQSPKFGRRLPSPTNTGTPGNVKTPTGTLRTGIRVHAGSLSQGCITCGTGVPGRKIEDALTDLVDRNANSGGTTLEIREKDCGKGCQ